MHVKQNKILLIGIGLAGMMFPAWAQYETIIVGDSCSYFGESMPYRVTSFRSDVEAEQVIENILDHSGLRQNFKIHAAGVPNAAAVVRHGKRYILYNQSFMRDMRSETGSKWAAISIMAHEIGHHLNGHTLDSEGSRPSKELEADEYSGAMVQKLDGSLDDALVAIETIGSDYGSRTHPAKRDRLAAIANGFLRSENLSSGNRSGGTRNDETASRDPDTGVDSRCESEGEWVEVDEIKYDGSGYVLDGKRCGEWTFDFGLQHIFVATFKNGKKHGPSSTVCQFAECTAEGNYKNDKKDGSWIETFPDSSYEGPYKNDKKNGLWIETSSHHSGKLVSEGSYRNDKKHGHWEITAKTSYGVSEITKVYRHGILLETIKH